jgi:hypothetical protein
VSPELIGFTWGFLRRGWGARVACRRRAALASRRRARFGSNDHVGCTPVGHLAARGPGRRWRRATGGANAGYRAGLFLAGGFADFLAAGLAGALAPLVLAAGLAFEGPFFAPFFSTTLGGSGGGGGGAT